eukprot:scaffold1.g5868.t1
MKAPSALLLISVAAALFAALPRLLSPNAPDDDWRASDWLPPAWAFRAFAGAVGRLPLLTSRLVPPHIYAVMVAGAFVHSKALYVLTQASQRGGLGVADELHAAGPLPVELLAGRVGADPDAVRRLLRAAQSVGFFRQPEPGVVANNRASGVLRRDHPSSVRDMVLVFGGPSYDCHSKAGEEGAAEALGALEEPRGRCCSRGQRAAPPRAAAERSAGQFAAGPGPLAARCQGAGAPRSGLARRGRSQRESSSHCDGHALQMLEAARGGPSRTAFQRWSGGPGFWEWLAAPGQEEQQASFNRAMESFGVIADRAILEGYPWGRHASARVADVGGGTGGFLAALLARHPNMTAVLTDRPEVVAEAERLWAARRAGLARRATFLPADFFREAPAADVYFLRAILHDWDDEAAATILRTLRRAAARGAEGGVTLLAVDMVLPERGAGWIETAEDLQARDVAAGPCLQQALLLFGPASVFGHSGRGPRMLAMVGGRERTEAEWRALLAAGGWRLRRVAPLRTLASLVEAVPEPGAGGGSGDGGGGRRKEAGGGSAGQEVPV